MIKQYVSPATVSAEMATEDEDCYVLYHVFGLSLSELNIYLQDGMRHNCISNIEFFNPSKEYRDKYKIYEEFVFAKITFSNHNHVDIEKTSKDFLYKYIIFIIKNTNIKIGEPINIYKVNSVQNKKLKFSHNSNSLYQYIASNACDDIEVANLANIESSISSDISDDIVKILSIQNEVLRFIAIYELIYRKCENSQEKTSIQIENIVRANGYTIPLGITWTRTDNGKPKTGDMLTYLRSKCAHSLEMIDFSPAKIDIMVDEFSKLEYEVKIYIGSALRILLDVLAGQDVNRETPQPPAA